MPARRGLSAVAPSNHFPRQLQNLPLALEGERACGLFDLHPARLVHLRVVVGDVAPLVTHQEEVDALVEAHARPHALREVPVLDRLERRDYFAREARLLAHLARRRLFRRLAPPDQTFGQLPAPFYAHGDQRHLDLPPAPPEGDAPGGDLLLRSVSAHGSERNGKSRGRKETKTIIHCPRRRPTLRSGFQFNLP